MVALPSMSSRGTALARTFASAFLALAEHAKALPHEVDEIASAVAAHLKSWKPLAVSAEPTMQLIPPTNAESELVKLRAEVETMRPTFVAAIAWRDDPDLFRLQKALINAVDAATPGEHEDK
jgi:hypothetical protein